MKNTRGELSCLVISGKALELFGERVSGEVVAEIHAQVFAEVGKFDHGAVIHLDAILAAITLSFHFFFAVRVDALGTFGLGAFT